jgi:hypothetical protein
MAAASGLLKGKVGSGSAGYQPVYQDEGDGHDEGHPAPHVQPVAPRGPTRTYRNMVVILSGLVVILMAMNLYLSLPLAFSSGSGSCPDDPPRVPQYFQISPNLWPGVTETGKPAFMAQTRVFEPTATFVPNDPLQTSIPIEGMKEGNRSIFQMMGYLSPYSPSTGFGVDEYPIPPGAEIVQVQMLSRHGARYPTPGANVATLGERLANASASLKTTGALEFLNDWKYELGKAILVPRGRQELFESGILHSYMYGSLYNPQSKLIVRTTTQDRMLKSAENWMAGFFGLEW